ncbi:MAG: class I SAM-dependent methyltransferase [Hyphomicrobiaceae bacterium]|nr:class I SAM-dependent methyltransferase [Hyphomicrobiaceae bacterium]
MSKVYASNIIDLYQRNAKAWDDCRGRSLFEKSWLDRFGALLPRSASVIDIGCGAGEPITGYLISRGFAVTGVDSAPAMIERCVARFPSAEFYVADMRALALQRRFGGLIAWDSFFHLTADDQRAMFPIFAAHAVEGAALLFTSGPQHGEAIGTFAGEPLYHASLDPTEYRALLDAAGFDVVEAASEDPRCGGHTVWLARKR